jgi:hypothetical protein
VGGKADFISLVLLPPTVAFNDPRFFGFHFHFRPEADPEEPASRPAVETHRRDVPKVKRFTARFVNSSLRPVFESIRVICGPFNLLPPP